MIWFNGIAFMNVFLLEFKWKNQLKIFVDRDQDKHLWNFFRSYKGHNWENQTFKTEICPDGKSFGLPKYVQILLHGLIQNWDWL